MEGVERLSGEDKVNDKFKPAMNVGELVAILKEYPQEMPVAILYELFDPIIVSMQTWTHDNYPYDQPDIDFVNLG